MVLLSFSLCLLSALKLADRDQQCPHLPKPTTIRWCQGGRLGGVKGAAAFNLVFVFVFCLLSLSLCLSRWCQGGRRLQPRLQIMSFQQLSSSSEILSQESFKTFTFSFKTLRILKREHSSGFGVLSWCWVWNKWCRGQMIEEATGSVKYCKSGQSRHQSQGGGSVLISWLLRWICDWFSVLSRFQTRAIQLLSELC